MPYQQHKVSEPLNCRANESAMHRLPFLLFPEYHNTKVYKIFLSAVWATATTLPCLTASQFLPKILNTKTFHFLFMNRMLLKISVLKRYLLPRIEAMSVVR